MVFPRRSWLSLPLSALLSLLSSVKPIEESFGGPEADTDNDEQKEEEGPHEVFCHGHGGTLASC